MDMSQAWPRLATSTQTWLVEHNGEPLSDDILDEILTVTAGSAIRAGGLGTPMTATPR